MKREGIYPLSAKGSRPFLKRFKARRQYNQPASWGICQQMHSWVDGWYEPIIVGFDSQAEAEAALPEYLARYEAMTKETA